MSNSTQLTNRRCLSSVLNGIWLFLAITIGGTVHAATRTADSDRQALIALENDWLQNEHNAAVLERILASDFLHPVATGDVLTKTEHIQFSSKHIPSTDSRKHFEDLQVRLYGDVAIITGLVVSVSRREHKTDKTVFTDVFVYRQSRWQAVNAQENTVKSSGRSQ